MPTVRDGALIFDRTPRGLTWLMPRLHRTAMTVGFVILSAQPVHGRLLAHEQWHIRQFCAWGPLFIPVYFLVAIPYGIGDIRWRSARKSRPGTRTGPAGSHPLVRIPGNSATRGEPATCPGDEATHRRADDDPSDHIARVVNPRVDAGVADRRGRDPERRPERRGDGGGREGKPRPTPSDRRGTMPTSASGPAAPQARRPRRRRDVGDDPRASSAGSRPPTSPRSPQRR